MLHNNNKVKSQLNNMIQNKFKKKIFIQKKNKIMEKIVKKMQLITKKIRKKMPEIYKNKAILNSLKVSCM